MEVKLHSFEISALDGTQWLSLPFGRFIPGETAPVTHYVLIVFMI